MARRSDAESRRLDEAAQAGWLYYVAGNTQDEIAKKMGVSRQSAQRMVSLAVSERLIKVRLDHPIARCMQLSLRLKDRFRLQACEVVPSDPADPSSIVGLAQAGAAEMERHLKSSESQILAIGTGRALRACADQLAPMDCPQHHIVSLLGNMMTDGSASAYNVVVRMADLIKAKHYPMPLPVLARTPQEKDILHNLEPIHNILELARRADATFVGIGNLGEKSPVVLDGFVTAKEMKALEKAGAIGEIISWVYDRDGKLIDHPVNDRVASTPLQPGSSKPVYGIAAGESKVEAILGALRGKLINALITNEHTAELLLTRDQAATAPD